MEAVEVAKKIKAICNRSDRGYTKELYKTNSLADFQRDVDFQELVYLLKKVKRISL